MCLREIKIISTSVAKIETEYSGIRRRRRRRRAPSDGRLWGLDNNYRFYYFITRTVRTVDVPVGWLLARNLSARRTRSNGSRFV